MTYQKRMTDSNAAFLDRIDARRTLPIHRSTDRRREELLKRLEVLDSIGYYRASRKKKKQMIAEAMSRSLKEFGAR